MVLFLSHIFFLPFALQIANVLMEYKIKGSFKPIFQKGAFTLSLGYIEISWAVSVMLHKAEGKVSTFNLQMLRVNESDDVFRCTRLGLFCVTQKNRGLLSVG